MTFTHALATDNYGSSKFIVSANIYEGTHTTIAAALTSASSGDTIFIRPGTYTENLTLKAGINLTAYVCDANEPNVIISGTCTATFTGNATLSGIRLQTNSAPFLTVSGSNATIINLEYCYLNALNNTGISYTASNASSQININHSRGDIGTTGITPFVSTSTGQINFNYSIWANSGASSTASTSNATGINLNYVLLFFPISITAASSSMNYTQINTAATNSTCLTTVTSGNHNLTASFFGSGSASAISIGASTAVTLASECEVVSSNTNAITGAGSVQFSPISMAGSSVLVNTTTQTAFPITFASPGTTGSTSRSLSNFDQGTFTPVIAGASTAGTGTYTNQIGRYQRVGRIVFITINITWTAHTGTGVVLITGLPFTANAAQTGYPMSVITNAGFLIATATQFSFYAVGSTTQINCYGNLVNAGTLISSSLAANSSCTLYVSGSYEI